MRPTKLGLVLPLLPAQSTTRPAQLGMLEAQLCELFLLSRRKDEGLLTSLAGAFVALVLNRHPHGARDTQVLPEYLRQLSEPAPEPLERTT